ncbi:GNAT family N-acetyltransferase [Kitasatospora sp. NBC_01287]|uniref:GNAT family N-acetyltransferase n=1 Tax=Kitasatospora sp. NBC_01287 TaxID=2903573 RepID=UPI00225A143F|nr:GNAT family N-acetyltransferase [Kitasatospora sp. NBC_01287]MCX4747310.1 GNAT family N-acetyltransferase [Kitasatospora sp. NBC_01287]
MKIRTATPDDLPAVLALGDSAVAWLTAQGRTGQWGSREWSTHPADVERIGRYARDYLMRLAEDDEGRVVGVCVLAQELPVHVTPAELPELYIRLLITDRARKGSGIGAALVADARAETVRRELPLLRVDCYRGDDQALVRQYLALGFTPCDTYDAVLADGTSWPGQVLEIRL